MTLANTPTLAVVGHPNTGKSSVVATLTERDDIIIDELPGETDKAKAYDLDVGSRRVTFVDTPGFQHPAQVYQWLQQQVGTDATRWQATVQHFLKDEAGTEPVP